MSHIKEIVCKECLDDNHWDCSILSCACRVTGHKLNVALSKEQEEKTGCSQHKKELFGQADMKVVAEAIGDLHYETLALLLSEMANKISHDGWKDEVAGRPKLAKELFMVAGHLAKASIFATWSYQISKPFMDKINQP